MRLGSLAVAHEIVTRGGDAIFQVTCRDRNRLALQNDLLSAHFLGLRNVLCLTGDHVSVGDHKDAKAVYDFESVQLLQCIKKHERGQRLGGQRDWTAATDFYNGAIVTPEADPIEPQMLKFEKKVEAGRAVLPDAGHLRHGQLPAVHGVRPAGDRQDRRQDDGRPGGADQPGHGQVHEQVRARHLRARRPARGDGLGAQGRGDAEGHGDLRPPHHASCKENNICDGVHIMAIGKEEIVPEILQMAGLIDEVPAAH